MDNRILHLDPARAKAWRKYVRAKKKSVCQRTKNCPYDNKLVEAVAGLLDGNYKEVVQTKLYHEGGRGHRLYFNDVDKQFSWSKTLEFVSLRLRQRYAVKNALRWS